MNVDGREVANFVLDCCDALRRPVTNLSLQKLVYFCHVWHLVKIEAPLVRHSFEAWQLGPVLQYLYRDFKSIEAGPITIRSQKLNKNTGKQEIASYAFDGPTNELLTKTVDFYSKLSAGTLVALSHVEAGPWHEAWTKGQSTNPGMRISNQRIVEFYSSVICPI